MTPDESERNLAVLRALSTALEDPELVIGVLFASCDEIAAVDSLRERFGWDVDQAEAVLSLQFKRAIHEHRSAVHRQVSELE